MTTGSSEPEEQGTDEHATRGHRAASASSGGTGGNTNAAASGRCAYVPPRLHVYGRARDLTSSGGRIGKNDKAVRHSRTGF